MRLSRWMGLIGLVMLLGCLQVAQRNAVLLKGYAVGQGRHRVHTEETAVAWLRAQVEELASPTQLAREVEERRLKLVAWSTPPKPGTAAVAQRPSSSLTHVAALDSSATVSDDETAD